MGLFDFLRSKKQPLTENSRRDLLLSKGRITEGTIIDVETGENGEEIAFYYYSVQGVDFESSDILTDEQKKNSIKYAPGAKVGIRYDRNNHGNCLLD